VIVKGDHAVLELTAKSNATSLPNSAGAGAVPVAGALNSQQHGHWTCGVVGGSSGPGQQHSLDPNSMPLADAAPVAVEKAMSKAVAMVTTRITDNPRYHVHRNPIPAVFSCFGHAIAPGGPTVSARLSVTCALRH